MDNTRTEKDPQMDPEKRKEKEEEERRKREGGGMGNP